ncbi:putative YigZ family protein [Acetoanaerobium pronyense]|uniref:YigZ family protein n=1 Tax=Acetoanaerobium pronyense TaxID=1482736 RepID=A0ABS4KIK2_9FIRM|nr:YigZ family protein [Acetoanaerobium pronyense]MBP2027613.1 putative YigZ family protein [Acetoanaerobium pronyense]
MKSYKTIYKEDKEELIIEKSRFIAHTKSVETEEDALEFIKKIKIENKDATHNVWAYVIGENQNIQRYSDDGEPSGTAGIPTLEILKKENLTNIVVVVTRYFGGIKLGAGGLVRAYSKACKASIIKAKITTKIIYIPVKISVDYSTMGIIENRFKLKNIPISDIEYKEDIQFKAYIPLGETSSFKDYLVELTNNSIDFSFGDPIYVDMVGEDIIIN